MSTGVERPGPGLGPGLGLGLGPGLGLGLGLGHRQGHGGLFGVNERTAVQKLKVTVWSSTHSHSWTVPATSALPIREAGSTPFAFTHTPQAM